MNGVRVQTASVMAFALLSGVGQAQEQEPHTARAYCLKVAPGRGAELEALVRDAGVPAERQRVAAGESKRFELLRGVIPVGSSARCDYLAVFHYGSLPEVEPGQTVAEYLSRAGVDAETAMKKWVELTETVGLQWWWYQQSRGPAWPEGTYVQVNFWRIPSNGYQNFVSVDGKWTPLVEAALTQGAKISWDQVGIWNPAEADGYGALTLDGFHDWQTMMGFQSVVNEVWPKVHPDMTLEQLGILHDAVAPFGRRELYRVVATTTR